MAGSANASQDTNNRPYPETIPVTSIAQRRYCRSEYRLTAPPARRSHQNLRFFAQLYGNFRLTGKCKDLCSGYCLNHSPIIHAEMSKTSIFDSQKMIFCE